MALLPGPMPYSNNKRQVVCAAARSGLGGTKIAVCVWGGGSGGGGGPKGSSGRAAWERAAQNRCLGVAHVHRWAREPRRGLARSIDLIPRDRVPPPKKTPAALGDEPRGPAALSGPRAALGAPWAQAPGTVREKERACYWQEGWAPPREPRGRGRRRGPARARKGEAPQGSAEVPRSLGGRSCEGRRRRPGRPHAARRCRNTAGRGPCGGWRRGRRRGCRARRIGERCCSGRGEALQGHADLRKRRPVLRPLGPARGRERRERRRRAGRPRRPAATEQHELADGLPAQACGRKEAGRVAAGRVGAMQRLQTSRWGRRSDGRWRLNHTNEQAARMSNALTAPGAAAAVELRRGGFMNAGVALLRQGACTPHRPVSVAGRQRLAGALAIQRCGGTPSLARAPPTPQSRAPPTS
jgi:hypothetical protein